jgi:hypothetical protein
VYHFGNTRLLRLLDVPVLSKLWEVFSRRTRIPFVIYTGRWNLPIPIRHKVRGDDMIRTGDSAGNPPQHRFLASLVRARGGRRCVCTDEWRHPGEPGA